MRENRLYSSEGGEAKVFPTPIRAFSICKRDRPLIGGCFEVFEVR